MKRKFNSIVRTACHSFGVVCAAALVLQFGALAGFAQTGINLYTGSETTITLNPGTYDITAYGAQGGACSSRGGLGAQMEGEFNFGNATTLTLLVGGAATEAAMPRFPPAAAVVAVLLSVVPHHWSSRAAAVAV